jgi:wyosine [tRNA(Phe)-imidazoG37] synthetase (radical SAM superfamily)
VYCQVGPTISPSVVRRPFYSPSKIAATVRSRAEDAAAAGIQIDFLTFVPDGEPTLDVHLADTITHLRSLVVDIAIITNASLLWRTDVRAAVAMADWVSVKVDAVDEPTWRRVNHPHESLSIARVLEGIETFAAGYRGLLTTETMLVAGVNDGDECLDRIGRYLVGVHPASAYVAVPTRPPAVRGVRPPTPERLNRCFQRLAEQLPHVELLAGYEGDEFITTGDAAHDLLGVCAVHPMRRSAVERLLATAHGDWATVESMLAAGQLVEVPYRNHTYFLRPIAASHIEEPLMAHRVGRHRRGEHSKETRRQTTKADEEEPDDICHTRHGAVHRSGVHRSHRR